MDETESISVNGSPLSRAFTFQSPFSHSSVCWTVGNPNWKGCLTRVMTASSPSYRLMAEPLNVEPPIGGGVAVAVVD